MGGESDDAGRQQRRQVVQASRKNQRLVKQMEQRPTLIAALSASPAVRYFYLYCSNWYLLYVIGFIILEYLMLHVKYFFVY